MRCHSCRIRFWIDSSGHLVSERHANLVEFTCPRCRHRDFFPQELLPGELACPSCQAGLRVHTDGAARCCAQQACTTGSATGRHVVSASGWRVVRGQPALFVCAVALVGLLVLGLGWWQLWERLAAPPPNLSPAAAAERFTLLCLQDRTGEAADFVLPEQRAHFQRWVTCWRAGLPGWDDRANSASAMAAELVQMTPQWAVVRVTVVLQSRYSISSTQRWLATEEGWRFDAAGAMQAIATAQE